MVEELTMLLAETERRLHRGARPVEVPGGLHRVEGFLSAIECDTLRRHLASRQHSTCSGSPRSIEGVSLVAQMYAGDEVTSDLMSDIAAEVSSRFDAHGLGYLFFPVAQFITYRSGDRKERHADGAFSPNRPWLGIILCLSPPDHYEGGEFEIDGEEPAKHTPGTLLIVPGHIFHEVHEVTAGERSTVTAFATPLPA